jgi:hypothetical protein
VSSSLTMPSGQDAVSCAAVCHPGSRVRRWTTQAPYRWVVSGPLGLRRLDRRGKSEVAKRFGDRRRLGPEGLVEGRDCLRFGGGSRPSPFSDIALIFARCKKFRSAGFQFSS